MSDQRLTWQRFVTSVVEWYRLVYLTVVYEDCSCVDCDCVVVLVVSGEGYRFLQFAWLYPRVLVQLLLFSLCSSVGQVCVCVLCVTGAL